MSRSRRYAVALPLTLALLAAVILGDYLTGWAVSFTLIYMLPVALAVWFIGRDAAIAVAAASAAAHFVIRTDATYSQPTNFWNSGILFGVLLTTIALLHSLKLANAQFPILRTFTRTIGVGLALAILLSTLGFFARGLIFPFSKHSAQASAPAHFDAPLAPLNPLLQLRQELASVLRTSRSQLLGSRDPRMSTCVSPVLTGQVTNKLPPNPGDYDGGPATTLALLLGPDREAACHSPAEELAWHQGRLRRYLENQSLSNRPATLAAEALARDAQALADLLSAAQEWPPELPPSEFTPGDDWPTYCLNSLHEATLVHDLPAAKRWSAEFAAATFALADLHRWLEFLDANFLTALDFQKRCEPLFASNKSGDDNHATISNYPAGLITLHGLCNFYEVEHEAERLFTMPDDRLQAIAADPEPDPASIHIPPTSRAAFRKLRQLLSPANQKTWDRAAATPYEHTYLANMIFRADQAGAIDQLAQSLTKLDQRRPAADLTELMGVLMYRGHSFAGIEWADRFQPTLLQAATTLPDADVDAFNAACHFTNDFYHAPATEYGVTFTLRAALEAKRLDCVRATDMIGSIFRDAGHPRFAHVRWSAGAAGHSVAALPVRQSDGSFKFLLADGLNPSASPETWPDAYFAGHPWPAEMQNNPPPYAVELYVRGLDNYIWSEGYIIRGPGAGTLTKAAIPYSTHHQTATTEKIFPGPYPN